MFGKGVFQEEENLLRNIIRSIDKRVDYSAKEGEGSRFTVHIKLRAHEDDVVLDLEDLKAAKTDTVKRHQIRQKIKAKTDHLNKSRYVDDILGLKPARLLKASPKPEPMMQRGGFGRGPRR
ncbi:MAG TPA: hypothetical protein VN826_13035 [Candidatus Eisenbacteria bacterium]|jgi:hypothetical protein|nr:hypothetical protein [Candidatus Eisenbacteria bacterium]